MTTGRGRTIGFVGVGQMGAPMAARLLEHGFRVLVCDRNPAALSPLVARGAVALTRPRDLADEAALVLGCLPDATAVDSVVFGADGLAGGGALRCYMETGTIGAGAVRGIAQRMADAGIVLLDTPVSRGFAGGTAGALTMVIAGDPAAVESVQDVVAALAGTVFDAGPQPGAAQICKIVNNAIGITGAVIAYEAVVMGTKAGLDPTLLVDVVNASTGRNAATLNRFPRSILPRSFDSFAPLGVAAKDIEIYLAEARALGVPVPLGAAVSQLWRMALNEPAVDGDGSSMIKMFERWAGVRVEGRPANDT
jgi:3-hydroxyisobutyrate dehydrogenase-like beta-hydroxyacid dehydrogenase